MKKNPIWIILDDVMDTYNIGSIFRLSEAVAASGLLLCAGAEIPPSVRIHKAAVGTEEWVDWKYYPTAAEAISELRKNIPGVKIISVEQSDKAISLNDLNIKVREDQPVAVVVGHETRGVSQEAMTASDWTVEIPMWGINKSLNVVVSTGIVVYKIMDETSLSLPGTA